MTPEEHKSRHAMLHEHLDELFADYIGHHPHQLIQWSKEQTENPTEEQNERV